MASWPPWRRMGRSSSRSGPCRRSRRSSLRTSWFVARKPGCVTVVRRATVSESCPPRRETESAPTQQDSVGYDQTFKPYSHEPQRSASADPRGRGARRAQDLRGRDRLRAACPQAEGVLETLAVRGHPLARETKLPRPSGGRAPSPPGSPPRSTRRTIPRPFHRDPQRPAGRARG